MLNMDQDGHGLSIITFRYHKNILLDNGGNKFRKEDLIKSILL